MPKFSYRAINAKGRPVRGVINAGNETDLFNRLNESGMALVDCKEMSEKSGKLAILASKRVKVRDLIQLFLHLEQLQKAGVPLLESLADVRETSESPRLRDVMSDVYNEVAEGSSLSNALSKHPGVFEPIFVSLINAGEETGNLTNSFEHLIKHLKWNDAMEVKVKKATRYPKILGAVIVLVVYVMLSYVVPEVTGFLREIGQELPMITKALIATSDFIVAYAGYIVVFFIAVYIFIRAMRSVSDSFRYHTDAIALRLPVAGMVIQKVSLSRFCSTFGVLFTSGLEILKCLEAGQKTVSNRVLFDALENVRQQVQEGATLSAALNSSGRFPAMVVRMVRIGEESGNLTHVLNQVSEFYDRDVSESVEAMITMIEPMLTAVLGGLMLWIAAAVFGPIYDSFSKMG